MTDPPSSQPTLFHNPPAPTCTTCKTTNPNHCAHDQKLDDGLVGKTTRRPKSCLRSWNPATAQIPY